MEIDICRDCVTHELKFGDFMDSQQKFLIFLSVKMNLRETLKMDATKFCINLLMSQNGQTHFTVNNLLRKAMALFHS